MTKTEEQAEQTDPFETWRQLYDANERAWTAALEQTMSSPEFDESSGKMLETMLAAQKSVRDNMRTYLETMNVPTREDIARLGELVVGLEEKIDQVVDRLDAIEEAVRAVPAGTSRTRRTRGTGRARPGQGTGRARRTSGLEGPPGAGPAARAAGKAKGPPKAVGRASASGARQARGARQAHGAPSP